MAEPPTPAAQRVPVSDRVFQKLVSDILSGQVKPGDKLPTQRALAAEMGLNMAPVREAIKRVEQLNLIEVRHGDAMRVLDWRRHGGLDVAAHLFFRAGALDQATFESMLEARRLFLVGGAWLAAERRSDEQVESLDAIAGELESSPDVATAQRLDFDFYSCLVEASGNLVFTLVMNSIRTLSVEYPALFEPVVHRPEELAPLYRDLAAAIAAGEGGWAMSAATTLAAVQEDRLRDALGGESAAA